MSKHRRKKQCAIAKLVAVLSPTSIIPLNGHSLRFSHTVLSRMLEGIRELAEYRWGSTSWGSVGKAHTASHTLVSYRLDFRVSGERIHGVDKILIVGVD